MQNTTGRVATIAFLLIPLLVLSSHAGDESAKQKKTTTNEDLAFGVVAKLADPYAIQTDFVMADDLLKNLYSLQDYWRKRDTSKITLAEGSSAGHYVEGVYQGFMVGVAAEDFRKHKEPKTGAPICEKEGTNLKVIVESAIRGLERIPEKQRHAEMASHAIIIQFLTDNLYGDCLKP